MADIVITKDELNDPTIDDAVNLQKSVQHQGGQRVDEIPTPFYYNPIFYYTLAAAMGGMAIWAITEQFYLMQEGSKSQLPAIFADYMLFGPVAGALGLSIGVVYGMVNRNWRQLVICACVGAGVAVGVTLLTTFMAGIVYSMFKYYALELQGIDSYRSRFNSGQFPFTGMAFFVAMCGRGIAWSMVSTGAGLGLGIALKSKKLVLNGLVGGMVGGLLGGLFFDPVSRFISVQSHTASLSRGIGFLCVCTFVGLFIGIFENLSKEAWFLMLKGPLAGKQFIIFKSPMNVGSSPKSEVYLFKDADIAPLHAQVVKAGSKYMLKDEGSDKGTYVNGKRIDKYILQPDDTITIGEAVLKYSEKSRG